MTTSMRIVHVITRLILGGAQENTLLTVDELHHRYHDDVTLITGPAEGPEGDLFDAPPARELNVEVMPELVRPIRPVDRLEGLLAPARGVQATEARGRAHPQLEGGHSGPRRCLARTRAGDRPHHPRNAVRSVRDAAEEPSLHRTREVGRPPRARHRQRLRCHDLAGTRRRSRPAGPVSHRL